MANEIDPYIEFIERCLSNWRWACRYIFEEDHSFDIFPFQHSILDKFFTKSFPMLVASRGASKTFILAVYAILKAIFSQDFKTGAKIIIIGPSFRQAREVFKHIEALWSSSPIFRECAPEGPKTVIDRCEIKIGNSIIMAVPLGAGDKIRGLRATTVLADEISMIPQRIFDTVVRGFTAVSQNPIERVKLFKRFKDAGVPKEKIAQYLPKNQLIVAGTAYYKFNHFYKLYDRYMNIIENKIEGSISQIDPGLGNQVQGFINYKDYAVIKISSLQLPDGFLDETQLANSRIGMSDSEYAMEYLAEFVDDSEGFFPRSMIDACVPSKSEMSNDTKGFIVELNGDDEAIYTMGVDPARTQDNLSIAIVKILGGKMKVSYMWSVKGKSFIEVTAVIRKILKKFNIVLMEIDKGGGGFAIKDNLQTEKLFDSPDDKLILDWDEKDKSKTGSRILRMVNYQGEWLRQANYGLKADLQHRRLMFPISAGEEEHSIADENNNIVKFEGSHVDDATTSWEEIQRCKEEMANIVKTFTPKTEEEHFDLPKVVGMKTVRRKDRYSALLMAVDAARRVIKGELDTNNNKKIEIATGDWLENL